MFFCAFWAEDPRRGRRHPVVGGARALARVYGHRRDRLHAPTGSSRLRETPTAQARPFAWCVVEDRPPQAIQAIPRAGIVPSAGSALKVNDLGAQIHSWWPI